MSTTLLVVVIAVLALVAWANERDVRDLQGENNRLIRANVTALTRIEELRAENHVLRGGIVAPGGVVPGEARAR
ncbi:MAG: hypothetical protein AB7J63_09880 [Vicinamibacterales bacterium]